MAEHWSADDHEKNNDGCQAEKDHQYRSAGNGECTDRDAAKAGGVQPAARTYESDECAKAPYESSATSKVDQSMTR